MDKFHKYWTVDVNMGMAPRAAWFPVVPTDGRHYIFDSFAAAKAFHDSLPTNGEAPYRITERTYKGE